MPPSRSWRSWRSSYALAGGNDRAAEQPGYASSDKPSSQAMDGYGVRDATQGELDRLGDDRNVMYTEDADW